MVYKTYHATYSPCNIFIVAQYNKLTALIPLGMGIVFFNGKKYIKLWV
jgi:hypothetical protein